MNYATKRLHAAAERALIVLEGLAVIRRDGDTIDELEQALHYFNAHGATQPDED